MSALLDGALILAFLEAGVRLGIPLALAALGETISERSGPRSASGFPVVRAPIVMKPVDQLAVVASGT